MGFDIIEINLVKHLKMFLKLPWNFYERSLKPYWNSPLNLPDTLQILSKHPPDNSQASSGQETTMGLFGAQNNFSKRICWFWSNVHKIHNGIQNGWHDPERGSWLVRCFKQLLWKKLFVTKNGKAWQNLRKSRWTSWGWAGPRSAANWDFFILWLTFVALYLIWNE